MHRVKATAKPSPTTGPRVDKVAVIPAVETSKAEPIERKR